MVRSQSTTAAVLLILLGFAVGPALSLSFSLNSMTSLWGFGKHAAPSPPTFPPTFEATYTFSMPFVYSVQTGGLSFPVHMWYDAGGKRLRTEVYGGLDTTLTVEDTTYMLYPRINKTVCKVHHDKVGPTLAAGLLADAPLPDISDWLYGGTTSIGNSQVHIWQLFERKWGKTSTYTFYTTPEGQPVRFYMMGFNIMAQSHFDEYLVDFTSFKPGPIDASVFEKPSMCEKKKPHKPTQQKSEMQTAQESEVEASPRQEYELATAQVMSAAAAVMPWGRIPNSAAAASLSASAPPAATSARPTHQQQQQQSEHQQQLRRLALRAQNTRFVEAWNEAAATTASITTTSSNGDGDGDGLTTEQAPAAHPVFNQAPSAHPGFKLALNRFADWTPEEYSLLRGKRSSSRSEQVKQSRSLGVVSPPPGLEKRHLPKHVSWRGTAADNVMKDQATCGSCWAFSAVGAMQGAWQLATGQTLSLSEQQLVDCSWNYGNNGCQGGEMEPAIQYVADAGGADAGEDYQYKGQNMFCGQNATHQDASPVAHFKGFANVKQRSETALMWALWKHGPVAISIDASQPTFKFYSEGVYSDKNCHTGKDYMDHAVLLVGYGTDKITGQDYWLVKNSWSKYWGEDGYIRMARTPGSGNDCGVTTDPVLAVVHPKYVKSGTAAAELLTQLQVQRVEGQDEDGASIATV